MGTHAQGSSHTGHHWPPGHIGNLLSLMGPEEPISLSQEHLGEDTINLPHFTDEKSGTQVEWLAYGHQLLEDLNPGQLAGWGPWASPVLAIALLGCRYLLTHSQLEPIPTCLPPFPPYPGTHTETAQAWPSWHGASFQKDSSLGVAVVVQRVKLQLVRPASHF